MEKERCWNTYGRKMRIIHNSLIILQLWRRAAVYSCQLGSHAGKTMWSMQEHSGLQHMKRPGRWGGGVKESRRARFNTLHGSWSLFEAELSELKHSALQQQQWSCFSWETNTTTHFTPFSPLSAHRLHQVGHAAFFLFLFYFLSNLKLFVLCFFLMTTPQDF